ncbi:rhamnan synthesis F family protein [uncultured Roseobacter sp.]|uniref:rhamnan synthesis F family protein n=1 Tax=uncultured Roseobacter sp. TaxID=114847 RepID=UPI0026336603|nr:rhamnan synthesis F family protein [uncultured Roseobacter sp.]
MPQWWKIRRELKRLGNHLLEWPTDTTNFLFGTFYYDRFLAHKKTILSGLQDTTDKRAVYLIFPKNGLQPGHFRTLDYLASKGFAVTVVSNLPLNPGQKVAVLPKCHMYIERPNYGYDFGGYRDGILSMRNDVAAIKQLVLLNDSVWFPVSSKTDWLADVDDLGVEFAGAVSNYGIPRVDPDHFRELSFDYRTDHKNFHYCSFALSLGQKIVQDPKFIEFWASFPLTNKKKRTVRRGEIGLTAWILRRGYSHAETLGVHRLAECLGKLSDPELRDVARHVIVLDDSRLKKAKANVILSIDKLSRTDLVNFVLMVAARQGTAYALAYYSVLFLGFPFLKKSPLWLDQDAAKISSLLLGALSEPAADEALMEANDLQLSK